MPLQEKKLLMAMELSNKKWKLCFGDGSDHRERTIDAGNCLGLFGEIRRAKEKLGLGARAEVVSCYEAGRDGFWIHRMLEKHGVRNFVMDPSSIEVSRHARKRKTDRLDVQKLLKLLVRYELWGERDSFSSVRVPSKGDETRMRAFRERERLIKERTAHRARLKSLCKLHGVDDKLVLKKDAHELRDWEGNQLEDYWIAEISHEKERLELVNEQIKAVEELQQSVLADGQTRAAEQARQLSALKSLGPQSSWLLAHECFAWRTFGNRKQLGSFAGLAGTPFDSGETLREQGISKAGNKRVRTAMIELAWQWVRWQKDSALTHWFVDRFGDSKRSRRKGIVALARKLLIALWKYLEHGTVPEGAILKTA